MHQQIRTSPDSEARDPDADRAPHERLKARLDAIRAAGVNVEGVAPELATTHLRFVVRDGVLDRALDALHEWEPTVHPAFTKSLGNEAGSLDELLGSLASDYTVESVLVLATDPGDGGVLVSVGIDHEMPWDEWRRRSGWDDEDHAGLTAV